MSILKNFISNNQYQVLTELSNNSDDADQLKNKLTEIQKIINMMTQTYEQDEFGYNAIAYLHYFKGNADFYITEKDIEDQQLQAYGLANIGYGGELGYISIDELIKGDVELDLYFQHVRIEKLI